LIFAVLHGTIHTALGIPLGGGISLVVQLFALGQGQLNLDPAVLKVERQRYQGVAVPLDVAVEPHDLPLVHEQLALPQRIAVEEVALLVGADVQPDDEKLAVFDGAIAVLHVHRAGAETLDLGARQGDAGLEGLDDVVIVPGLAVLGDLLGSFLKHGSTPPSLHGASSEELYASGRGKSSYSCVSAKNASSYIMCIRPFKYNEKSLKKSANYA